MYISHGLKQLSRGNVQSIFAQAHRSRKDSISRKEDAHTADEKVRYIRILMSHSFSLQSHFLLAKIKMYTSGKTTRNTETKIFRYLKKPHAPCTTQVFLFRMKRTHERRRRRSTRETARYVTL